jgi:hypothetical protein
VRFRFRRKRRARALIEDSSLKKRELEISLLPPLEQIESSKVWLHLGDVRWLGFHE